ncbi:hypothetical protein ACFQ73_09225 [Amycolatopsis japonica]|uniref:hypothetical protein n=1 Tax=Amycolatopsis japonica TaxID=208439 RepID=UPI00366AEA46
MDFDTYLFNVGSALREVERDATVSIVPEAFPRGRELVDTYTTAAKLLADKVDGYRHQDGAAEDVLRGYMTETTVALKMPKPPGLELATLAATDGTVAQANERAENCRPAKAEPEPSTAPVALPQAKDGGNLSACSDGRCEVLVFAGAVVPVPKRFRFDVFRVRAIADGIMQIGAKGGNASMTSPMETGRSTVLNGLGVTAVAVGDGKAVLRLASV